VEVDRRKADVTHVAFIALSIATLFSLFIALRPSNPRATPTRVCKDADVLYLTELSLPGPRASFTSQYVTEVQLTQRITSSEGEIANGSVRAAVHALAANLTSRKIASLPTLNDLLKVCRSKGFLKGG
jgi:hypothetical protein